MMKRKNISIVLLIALCFSLNACCLSHDWQDATCEEPRICTKCGKTEGDPLEHKWVEATCTEPKTCSACGKNEGKALGHKATPATCTEDSICSRCSETVGMASGHEWIGATAGKAKTCKKCGLTEGEPLGYVYFPMDSHEFIEAYNRSEHALGTLTKDSNHMKIVGTQKEIIFFAVDVSNYTPGSIYIIPKKEFNEMIIRLVMYGNETYDTDALTMIVLIGQSFAEIFDPTFDCHEFLSDCSYSKVGNKITMSYSHNGFEYRIEGFPDTLVGTSYYYDFEISLTANKE